MKFNNNFGSISIIWYVCMYVQLLRQINHKCSCYDADGAKTVISNGERSCPWGLLEFADLP